MRELIICVGAREAFGPANCSLRITHKRSVIERNEFEEEEELEEEEEGKKNIEKKENSCYIRTEIWPG